MLQNLLSKTHKKKIRTEYYLRLTTVVALLLSLTLIIGAIALLPSYVDVQFELKAKKEELTLRQGVEQDNKTLDDEVKQTIITLKILQIELQREKLTEIISEVLNKRPDGISMIGYSYDRKGKIFTVEGIASTRDLVAPFARALESSERFSTAPVPISDLAKNTNLNFRLQIGIEEEE